MLKILDTLKIEFKYGARTELKKLTFVKHLLLYQKILYKMIFKKQPMILPSFKNYEAENDQLGQRAPMT